MTTKLYKILGIILLLGMALPAVSLEIQNVDTDVGTLDIYMVNDEAIGGFQFELFGVDITGAAGGSSGAASFMISSSPTTILGFSITGATIPVGEAVLLQVTFENYSAGEICFGEDTGTSGSNTISSGTGSYIAADWADCTCPSGLDECGICGGDNSSCLDCNGVPNGDAEIDECGICGGDNSTCTDCLGEINGSAIEDCNNECEGSAYYDNCGVCVGGNTEIEPCTLDCMGILDGVAELDDCGVCNGDNTSCMDCNGDVNGSAYIDACQNCVMGNTGEFACLFDCQGQTPLDDNWQGPGSYDNCGFCDSDPENNCVMDCTGVWGGMASKDQCGICEGDGTSCLDECGIAFGDNSTCEDCNGTPFGTAELDNCGTCVGGETGEIPCSPDCEGIWGGSAIKDCAGICGGSTVEDECGVCGGDNSSCADCNGEANGEAYLDNCGICDSDPENDCTPDCSGIWGGESVEDECGICGGDNSTCIDVCGVPNGDNSTCEDCFGIPNGGAIEDCNGVCGGIAVEMEDGDCCLEGFVDFCGVCAGPGAVYECGCGGLPEGYCDCASTVPLDECGICGGDGPEEGTCDCDGNVLDECGICGGDNSTCTDCLGEINGSAVEDVNGECCSSDIIDECGVCNGDGIPDGYCDCNGNTEDDCNGECGGPAIEDDNGECCLTGEIDCLGVCDGNAKYDCRKDNENFPQDAESLTDYCEGEAEESSDGECCILDGNGDCCDSGDVDDCGVCNGTGIPEGACDCDGNVEDCNGICGGPSQLDDCGICDGIEYFTINGLPGGETCEQGTFNCLLPNFNCDCNESKLDCTGECGGENVDGASGECIYVEDKDGIWCESEYISDCNTCYLSGIPTGACDCFGSPGNCAGDCPFQYTGVPGVWEENPDYESITGSDLDFDGICDDKDDCISGGENHLIYTADGSVITQADDEGFLNPYFGGYDVCGVCNGDGFGCDFSAEGSLSEIQLNWRQPFESNQSGGTLRSGNTSNGENGTLTSLAIGISPTVKLEFSNVEWDANDLSAGGSLDIYMTNMPLCEYCTDPEWASSKFFCEQKGNEWILDPLSTESLCNSKSGTYFDGHIGGFQFDISGIAINGLSGGSLEANGFNSSSSVSQYIPIGSTVLGFSLTGTTIGPGENELLTTVQFTFPEPDSLDTGICFGDDENYNILSDKVGVNVPLTEWGDCTCIVNNADDCGVCGGTGVQQECGCGELGAKDDFGRPKYEIWTEDNSDTWTVPWDGIDRCSCAQNKPGYSGYQIWDNSVNNWDNPGFSFSQDLVCWDGVYICEENYFESNQSAIFECSADPNSVYFNVYRENPIGDLYQIANNLTYPQYTDSNLGYEEKYKYAVSYISEGVEHFSVSETNEINLVSGETDALEIGCIYPSAFNFVETANYYDGNSCWWPNFGCDGSEGEGATVDNCGVCDSNPANNCSSDCAGVWGGSAYIDDCGVCAGGTTGIASNYLMDCANVCGGSAYVDNCGICDDDPKNDCNADCAGVYDGVAILDNCNICTCNGQNSEEGNGCEDVEPCKQDCNSVWGGTGVLDLFGDCCLENCILTGCDLPDLSYYLTETGLAFNSSEDIKRILITLNGITIQNYPVGGEAGNAQFL